MLCLGLIWLSARGELFLARADPIQAPVLVREAEYATDYGTFSGRLIVVSDQMVFIERDYPQDSFAIARNEIRAFHSDSNRFTIETMRPLHSRLGDRLHFQFTIRDGTVEPLTLWAGARQTNAQTTLSEQQAQWAYVAKHRHGLGSCTGNLLLGKGRLTYDALDDRDHTRQWLFRDIYRTRRRSPYRLEVETRAGEKYTLELQGRGMDIAVYRQLQNWISLARRRG